MDLQKFKEISIRKIDFRNLLAQDMTEWQIYLEIIAAYFQSRKILKPVVVEIGLMHNSQRQYYKEILGAEHIGIDVNQNSQPDILGDSHAPETLKALEDRLEGRKIDLLFIDGNHSYRAAQMDFIIYEPLTKHIIAFHDIAATVNSEVYKLWATFYSDPRFMIISLNKGFEAADQTKGSYIDMGIGLLLRQNTDAVRTEQDK